MTEASGLLLACGGKWMPTSNDRACQDESRDADWISPKFKSRALLVHELNLVFQWDVSYRAEKQTLFTGAPWMVLRKLQSRLHA